MATKKRRTGRGLLAEIFANPDDDAARLVYADHLIEQGDPRGELIQVQCALAARPRVVGGDGDEVDEVKDALQKRERKLLKEHAKAWLAPIRAHVATWAWRRGFVFGVRVAANGFAANAPKIVAATPLEALELRSTTPALFATIAKLPALRGLRHLKLWQQKWIDPRRVADSVALLASPVLANVHTLDLFGSRLGDAGIAALASHPLPALRQLNLEHNELTTAAIAAMVAAPWFGNLEILSIRGNADLPVGAAAPIATAGRSLLELDVCATARCDDVVISAIAGSRSMRKLRRLDTGYLSVAGAAAIATSANLKGVVELAYSEVGKRTAFRALEGRRSHDWHRFGVEDFS